MIRLVELRKEYTGVLGHLTGHRVRALDGVSLEVPAGSALGIVGPNGAGKSTLFRLLLGFLRPTAGEATIGGLPPRAYVERWGIGYVSETVAIPPRWTVRGALRFFAALAEVDSPVEERIEAQLRAWGLREMADRRVSALSKGNLQRLAIAQALLAPRRVMILDEPADGLDPEWTARLREGIVEWRAGDPGRTLLVASHNLAEVERIADRVAVLEGGRVREMVDLRPPEAGLPPYRLETDGESAERVRECFPGAETEADAPFAFRVGAPDLPELNRRLAEFVGRGGIVRALHPARDSLEDRFRRPRDRDGERA